MKASDEVSFSRVASEVLHPLSAIADRPLGPFARRELIGALRDAHVRALESVRDLLPGQLSEDCVAAIDRRIAELRAP